MRFSSFWALVVLLASAPLAGCDGLGADAETPSAAPSTAAAPTAASTTGIEGPSTLLRGCTATYSIYHRPGNWTVNGFSTPNSPPVVEVVDEYDGPGMWQHIVLLGVNPGQVTLQWQSGTIIHQKQITVTSLYGC